VRRPRISIASLIVLFALLTVTGLLAIYGLAVSRQALDDNLALRYSWIPHREKVPRGDPVYAEHITILDTDQFAGGLRLLALGAPPIVAVLGLGVAMLIWNLITRGRCSPFLFGLLASGAAVLFAYFVASILAPHSVERYARVPANALARGPVAVAGGVVPDLLAGAIRNSAWLLVLGLPQVLVALLGGWLNEKILRITLTILPRTPIDSAATACPEAA
jgi:hypothetical protein